MTSYDDEKVFKGLYMVFKPFCNRAKFCIISFQLIPTTDQWGMHCGMHSPRNLKAVVITIQTVVGVVVIFKTRTAVVKRTPVFQLSGNRCFSNIDLVIGVMHSVAGLTIESDGWGCQCLTTLGNIGRVGDGRATR